MPTDAFPVRSHNGSAYAGSGLLIRAKAPLRISFAGGDGPSALLRNSRRRCAFQYHQPLRPRNPICARRPRGYDPFPRFRSKRAL